MRATLDAAHRLGDWTEGDVTITVPPLPPPTDGP
jgi:hypothetical protein